MRIHCNEDTYISTMFLYLSKELISEVPCHTEFLIFSLIAKDYSKRQRCCHCCVIVTAAGGFVCFFPESLVVEFQSCYEESIRDFVLLS